MLKDITQLKISGKCFTKEKDLTLFENRLNIVFGRNGAGKSTISNAIRNIAAGISDSEVTASFDSNLEEGEDKQIFVYDEKFVDDKIKITHDGYDTIVMIGQQNEVQAEIVRVEKELSHKQEEQTKLNDKLTELQTDKNVNSSLYWKKELSNSLKRKGNFWAERFGKIRQKKQNGAVTEELLASLISLFFQFSSSEYIDENIHLTPKHEAELGEISKSLQRNIEEYLKAKTHGKIKNTVQFSLSPPDWAQIGSTLTEVVNEPTLSDRDKKIVEQIKNKVLPDYLSESYDFFKNDQDICPFCLRSMNNLDINQIFTTLSNILNKDVQTFKSKTRTLIENLKRIYDEVYNLADLSSISPQEPLKPEIEAYKSCKSKLERVLTNTIKKLTDKEKSPYQSISCDDIEKNQESFCKYSDSIIAINAAIERHNERCSQLADIERNLYIDNEKLAVYETYETIKNFLLKGKAEKKLSRDLQDLDKKVTDLRVELQGLKSKQKNVCIALERINESLRFIFFDANRLTLENKDGKYCVKTRNKRVKPNALSVGERNAISMAYFFTSMHEGCNAEDVYKKERLIVIDDPITSFDQENRVGMLSFLHWQVEQMLRGNENSKILFLSHDIQTVVDLSKFSANLNKEKDPGIIGEIDQSVWLLQNAQLRKIPTTNNGLKFNEYRELLLSIFDFANTISTASTLPVDGIGNKMRRIAEAISTFLYSCGIEELLRKEQLLRGLDVQKKEHYRNTLFRLVFNGMSHTQDKIKGLNSSYEVFAPSEVQKIAKSFLLFLKDTHELHLFCMLDNTKMQVIKNWEKEIFPSS